MVYVYKVSNQIKVGVLISFLTFSHLFLASGTTSCYKEPLKKKKKRKEQSFNAS